MADDLQLAFCIDDRFAPHLAVCLHSIQTHLGHGMAARAHIIGDLSPDVARRLGSMAGDRLDLAFHVRVPDFSHLHISPTFASRLSIATYHRLALPELLPGRDRILYLDADMLALTDLTPLWETDLHGCAAAVVQDYFLGTEKRWERLGLPHPEYFNAGMMLMDLNRWREENLAACVAEAVAEHPDWEYNDQDGLNVVLNGQCLDVDPRWNATTTRLRAGAVENPALVHFTGQEKPWHVSSVHPFRDAYRDAKQHTPWKEAPLEHFLDHVDRHLLDELLRARPDGGCMAIYGCGARGRRLALYLRDQHPGFTIRFMVDRSAAGPFEGIPVHRHMPDNPIDIDALLIASVPFRDEILASLPPGLSNQIPVI